MKDETITALLAATDENKALLQNVGKIPPLDRLMEQCIVELFDDNKPERAELYAEKLQQLRAARLMLFTFTDACTKLLTEYQDSV